MSVVEQLEIKTKYYNEALRYMDNAKKSLKDAGKEDNYYLDDKYVKTACGTAYVGVLKALDGYFILNGVEKRKGRKSIQYYESTLTNIDEKMLNYLNSAYRVLHLEGYYEGETRISTIQSGFEAGYDIIEKIKP